MHVCPRYRRLAANILNKQSRTDNKGWPSSLGVGRGVNNPPPLTVKKLVTKTSKEPRTWTDSLDKRPKLWNMDMRFGTWNFRTLIDYWWGKPEGKRPLGKPRRR
jgi:hypothetical protein